MQLVRNTTYCERHIGEEQHNSQAEEVSRSFDHHYGQALGLSSALFDEENSSASLEENSRQDQIQNSISPVED